MAKAVTPTWSTQWTPTAKVGKAGTPSTPKTDTTTTPTAPKQTGLTGGITEEIARGQAQTQYDAGKALRQYQLDAAKMNLARNLATIDRSAIEQYKGIANDYAARGLQRSGGFMKAQSEAQANALQQTTDAQQSMANLEQQSKLEDIQALAGLQGIDYNILQQYIAALMAGKIEKTGQA